MKVILLEHVTNLGKAGNIVQVKPGYARNFLLPKRKVMRATKDNIASLDAKRKEIDSKHQKNKNEATIFCEKYPNVFVTLLHEAASSGALYGSVRARDILESLKKLDDLPLLKTFPHLGVSDIIIPFPIKVLGLFKVSVSLHYETFLPIVINVASSQDEADRQQKEAAFVGQELVKSSSDTQEVSLFDQEKKNEEQMQKANEDTNDIEKDDDGSSSSSS